MLQVLTKGADFMARPTLATFWSAAAVSVLMLSLAPPRACADGINAYSQTNLVSDIPGQAAFTDANLVNPWGIAFGPTSPVWISDNHTGVSTLYKGDGQSVPLVVTIPPPGGSPPGTTAAPTGVVFNGGSSFTGDKFIFATEDGTIAGWQGADGTSAVLSATTASAVYKGLALGNNGSGDFIYAANFNSGKIDVFDTNYSPVNLAGNFTDPTLPAGYAPFNVENIAGKLYVTYALQNGSKHDDVAGPGHGYVDVFDTNGNFVERLISAGALNSPWGMAVAPIGFGPFSNDLLIGNFGDGTINAFDLINGNLLGTLEDGKGNPIIIQGLWGLQFGNGALGFDTKALYFTAGIPGSGHLEDHGLFGDLQAVPEPGSLILFGTVLVGLAGFIRSRCY
jgi:uncharacterized protein (TIGR03118 family)